MQKPIKFMTLWMFVFLWNFQSYSQITAHEKYVNFSPYTIPGQDPNRRTKITGKHIIQLLDIIKGKFTGIRTYGVTDGLDSIPYLAKQRGFKVYMGVWISRDTTENAIQIAKAINIAKAGYADEIIVGSEVLLRKDLSVQKLIEYIKKVKTACPNLPVSCADVYSAFIQNPQLVSECSKIWANIYPLWQGVPIECAMSSFHQAYLSLLPHAKGKEIIISESGWKSTGNPVGLAVPSLANAIRYNRELLHWSKALGVKVFLFSAFDEPWKLPNDDGWGIFDNKGVLKPGMEILFEPITKIDTTWNCTKINNVGKDTITFDIIPPVESSDPVFGHVNFVYACSTKVTILIKVDGRWWTKPTFDQPTVPIYCNGQWVSNYATGGLDRYATEICAFLIPASYNPPACSGCGVIPQDLIKNAIARKCVTRYTLKNTSIKADQDSICKGGSTSLTATGGLFYVWSNGTTNNTIKVAPDYTTTYQVTVSDGLGGGAVHTKTINVLSSPTVEITRSQTTPICPGKQVSLTANQGKTYLWTTGQTTRTISIYPTNSDMYGLTLTDKYGCSSKSYIAIIVDKTNSKPYVTPPVSCKGKSNNVAFSTSSSSRFLWSTGATTSSITLTPTKTTSYTLTVTTENGCSEIFKDSLVPFLVRAIAKPDTICVGEKSWVVAKATYKGTYRWSTGALGDSLVVKPTTNTLYKVIANYYTCADTASTWVTLNNLALSVIDSSRVIIAKAQGGIPPYLFSSAPNLPQPLPGIFQKITSGKYTITVQDKLGCVVSRMITNVVDPQVKWKLKLSPNPSTGWIRIASELTPFQSLNIKICDVSGKVIKDLGKMTTQADFDLTDLPSGTYFCMIDDGTFFGVMQLLLIREK